MSSRHQCSKCGSNKILEIECDLTCTSCGLVLQTGIWEDGPEWRNFEEDGVDFSRVGDAEDGYLSLKSSSNKYNTLSAQCLTGKEKRQRLSQDLVDKLTEFQKILRLSDSIIDLATAIYKLYNKETAGLRKGERIKTTILAVCIYYAAKQTPGAARSKTELCEYLALDSKTFSKECTNIKTELQGTMYEMHGMRKGVNPEDIMYRMIDSIDVLTESEVKNVRKTVWKIHAKVVPHSTNINPVKLNAACIFVACRYLQIHHVTLKKVSECCNTSLTTLIQLEKHVISILRK